MGRRCWRCNAWDAWTAWNVCNERIPAVYKHRRPLFRKQLRGELSDPVGRARDQEDAVRQWRQHLISTLVRSRQLQRAVCLALPPADSLFTPCLVSRPTCQYEYLWCRSWIVALCCAHMPRAVGASADAGRLGMPGTPPMGRCCGWEQHAAVLPWPLPADAYALLVAAGLVPACTPPSAGATAAGPVEGASGRGRAGYAAPCAGSR